jgi:hypothetical protein
MDSVLNKLRLGLAAGLVMLGSGCIKAGNEVDTTWRCCTTAVLVFQREGGPAYDYATWRVVVGSPFASTLCIFGAGGWQCDNPDFVAVPPPPGTRGMPRSTELRIRGWQHGEQDTASIQVTADRAFVPLPHLILAEGIPICATDDDAPRATIVLPMPASPSGDPPT